MDGTPRDEQEVIRALSELDLHLKRQAERAVDHARRHPDDADQMWHFCSDLIEQARGVRMAMELVRGGKLLAGVLVPASTLAETWALVEEPSCRCSDDECCAECCGMPTTMHPEGCAKEPA